MGHKDSISDFTFIPRGHGHYEVTYTSPLSRKTWRKVTNNMPLIDATRNSDSPLRKDLQLLKAVVKTGTIINK